MAATTSAPRTASSNEAARVEAELGGERRAFAGSRPAILTSSQSRTRREHLHVRARLRARPEDRQHARVVAGKQARGERSCTGGARLGDVRPVEQRGRRPGLRVEEHDRRLVRRPVGVPREERHELAAEPCGRQVRGHRAEQPPASAAIRGGIETCPTRAPRAPRKRTDELVQIEELLDIGAREDEHRKDVKAAAEGTGRCSSV